VPDEPFDDASTRLRPDSGPDVAARATFVVHVETGADRGQSLTLDAGGPARALVGASHACDLQLSDREVSRRHLALEVEGQRLRLTDLDSSNGTAIGPLRVVGALLGGGELVRIGATTLRIERRDGPRTPPSSSVAMRFGDLVGTSPEMRRIYPVCERLAKSNVTVVIEGETGTGKEELARALHESGPRADGPFVVFDCTAVPASLVESELFGHERGAFTGAVGDRKGVFERAHLGTLLIDEIGDLDLALQPKLLRAVERGEIQSLGGSRTTRVDVRLLVATRRDLDKEVECGRFRDDLFHRLAVARIELPPLRKRSGDVRLLAAYFCAELGGDPGAISARLLRTWESWSWPGNVRELRNAVARQLALGDLAEDGARRPGSGGDAVSGTDLIDEVLARGLPIAEARQLVVDAFEARYLEHVLAENHGNVTRAAAASGIARRHFYRLRTRAPK
jgi:transcriptional regulator with GAF, ATPase, and Fis domain